MKDGFYNSFSFVVPAKAGIQLEFTRAAPDQSGAPAFAGVTEFGAVAQNNERGFP